MHQKCNFLIQIWSLKLIHERYKSMINININSTKSKFLTAMLLMITLLAHADEPDQGQVAPDFTITQMDGTQFTLSDFKGKQSVYLVFWNTWCTYCMKKIPKLKEVQKDLADDIRIIAVNTTNEDTVEASEKFQKRFNINYPLAFDHGKKVTDAYGVWGTPTEFIIDINGVIQYRDGVPDDIEGHLKKWNKPHRSYASIFKAYLTIVKTIVKNFNQPI